MAKGLSMLNTLQLYSGHIIASYCFQSLIGLPNIGFQPFQIVFFRIQLVFIIILAFSQLASHYLIINETTYFFMHTWLCNYCVIFLCSKIRRLKKILHETDKVWKETIGVACLNKTFMWSAISPGE